MRPPSRWVKNDYELVRWPPDKERDAAEGIILAGDEKQNGMLDPTQVRLVHAEPWRAVVRYHTP